MYILLRLGWLGFGRLIKIVLKCLFLVSIVLIFKNVFVIWILVWGLFIEWLLRVVKCVLIFFGVL